MRTDRLLDTNVLIYAFSRGDVRWTVAQEILADGGVFSAQIANEFVDVGRRKLSWSWSDAARALKEVKGFLGDAKALTGDMQERGLDISARHGLRIFDSSIVATAAAIGCRILLTEDLGHGQVIDGIEIRNPFRELTR